MKSVVYIHVYACTHTHTQIHNIHTYMHACMHAYMHACIHTCIQCHTCTHTHMHACMHAYIHACMHTYMHAYKRTHIDTHTHIHTYTHTHIRNMTRQHAKSISPQDIIEPKTLRMARTLDSPERLGRIKKDYLVLHGFPQDVSRVISCLICGSIPLPLSPPPSYSYPSPSSRILFSLPLFLLPSLLSVFPHLPLSSSFRSIGRFLGQSPASPRSFCFVCGVYADSLGWSAYPSWLPLYSGAVSVFRRQAQIARLNASAALFLSSTSPGLG
jgi:hypothetical protein